MFLCCVFYIRQMKKIVVIGCFLCGIFAACIPVVDRFAPEIDTLSPLRDSYFVQDTIRLILSFGDNDRLDSAIVTVLKIGDTSSDRQVWNPTITRRLFGRRFDDTLRIVIPANAPLGTYQMTVRLFDLAKNQTARQFQFNVLGDARPPVIRQLALVGLQRDLAGDYLVCRQTILNLVGLATDNIRIREVKAEIAGVFSVTRTVNSDSVRFDGLFGRDLRIPSNVPDNVRLLLVITVTDHNNNSVTRNFILWVSCDQEPPQIRIQRTEPQIDSVRAVRLFEGDGFRILAGTITDNRRLGRLAITFNPIGERRDTVFRANLTGNAVQLGSLLDGVIFRPPANAVGRTYEINLFAADSARNNAPPFQILLNVIKDEPPRIILTETRIGNQPVTLSTTQANFLPIGEELRIFGKILEDRALEYVQIFWGPASNPTRVVNLTASELTSLPFDLSDPRSVNRFVIMPSGTTPASLEYILELRAKDTRNPEVKLTYRFFTR